jgi:hypothetical protein
LLWLILFCIELLHIDSFKPLLFTVEHLAGYVLYGFLADRRSHRLLDTVYGIASDLLKLLGGLGVGRGGHYMSSPFLSCRFSTLGRSLLQA